MNYTMNEVPDRVTKMREQWAASDAKRDKGLKEPESLDKFRDISYGPYDKWNLLDVYVPKDNNGVAFPVILNIHGGGYFYGDKELYRFYCMHLAEFGFAVVNINYRLAPEFNFPSPVEDAAAVVNWIDENADEYKLDRNNIFMVGDSAGAQLVSQFAAVCTNPEYAGLFKVKIPERLKFRAVGLACGMYRLPEQSKGKDNDNILFDYLGGKTEMSDPIIDTHRFVNKNYPPAYVFTSHCDFLKTECEPYAEFLKSKGIEAESKIYGTPEAKEIAHVFHCDLRLEEGEKANKAQTDFFKKHIVR